VRPGVKIAIGMLLAAVEPAPAIEDCSEPGED
jgi:hypothetical protein